jgi:lipopolysaccharide transport system permease protein
MYATPVVYPLSQVPEKYRFLYHLNPMADVITNFRAITMGVGKMHGPDMHGKLGCNFVGLLFGLVIFTRVEKSFMDTV